MCVEAFLGALSAECSLLRCSNASIQQQCWIGHMRAHVCSMRACASFATFKLPNAAVYLSVYVRTSAQPTLLPRPSINQLRSCALRPLPARYMLFDTPGQIEVFTWSASGTIITETLANTFPTVVVYVVDTPRCVNPVTFMSNMMCVCENMPQAS